MMYCLITIARFGRECSCFRLQYLTREVILARKEVCQNGEHVKSDHQAEA